ncbi:hypothetical protein BOTBODRAFT_53122 [Botryobasidium botryosum FD-172 SS1]|uniref:Protein BNI4 n=1 Tax=Botryobasidium botryosum (strain FD-172 SS1) TaxID=930990 RepID=A0A067N038_BOTB1|nr:hypothetical protein BOTBODRAFT_53122 [Botryobasidium botryosum FD-172 SS1]
MDSQQPNVARAPRRPAASRDASSTAPAQDSLPATYPSAPFNVQQWPNQGIPAPPGQGAMSPQFAYPAYPAYFQPQMNQPYFDPQQQTQQQFAQWAYQQMMFSAQQHHQLAAAAQGTLSDYQRSRTQSGSESHHSQQQYFPNGAPAFQPGFAANSNAPSRNASPATEAPPQPFHPYRRPRGPSQSTGKAGDDWRSTTSSSSQPLPPVNPPYAQKNGSATSLNSSSGGGSARSGTDNGRRQASSGASGSPAGTPHGSVRSRNPPHINTDISDHRQRPSQQSPAPKAPPRPPSPSGSLPKPHHHRGSSTSSHASVSSATTAPRTSGGSNGSSSPPTSASPSHSGSARGARQPPKPSPLSQQQTFTASPDLSKRLSRDDSDLVTGVPTMGQVRSHGLKNRLRRALSLSAGQQLAESEAESTRLGSRRKVVAAKNDAEERLERQRAGSSAEGPSSAVSEQDPSLRSVKQKRSGSLFNKKFNASTDNISLSSTVSSASVMIRKLGSMGKLARRNSLMSITGLFKDKNKDGVSGEGSGKKGSGSKKADVVEASVTHTTVELDRGGEDVAGLSPAAMLARQHTLRTNAEAAAPKGKGKLPLGQAQTASPSKVAVPAAWERNTATRGDNPLARKGRASEDGRRADSFLSEEGSEGDVFDHISEEGGDDGDITVRVASLDLEPEPEIETNDEPWAVGIRRSLEKTLRPTKGILKHAGTYVQDAHLSGANSLHRSRSNSYNAVAAHTTEPGPLSSIPSPDPDHIDGLHKSTSPHETIIPPLDIPSSSFFSSGSSDKSPQSSTFAYAHPHMNSSAPALSTMFSSSTPSLGQRSTTTPAPSKKISFAAHLSVYDTFSPRTYDRRSEPATCNRLTPALAQRIKEELNSYKMEEMEVHYASRVHTHFFV